MMVPKCVLPSKLSVIRAIVSEVRLLHTSASVSSGKEYWWGPEKNAGREVVGFGATGTENYTDRLDYWYPAIRFRKDDDVILAIREKEKGDWKNLTIDEKRTLYRYTFRQTMSEFLSRNGYWKIYLSGFLFIFSLAVTYMTLLKIYVYPPIPPTFQNEWKEMEIEKMLVLERGRFMGPAAYFDYEKNEWTK